MLVVADGGDRDEEWEREGPASLLLEHAFASCKSIHVTYSGRDFIWVLVMWQ
jgi:hypothetical protein